MTSQVTAVPPISAASASIRSARRAAQKTRNPAAASIRAVAAPIPLLAPVTTAVRTGAVGEADGWLMVAIVVAHSSAVTPTTLARVAGVLGGLCWVVRAVLDDGNGPTSLINALHYGGLALLVHRAARHRRRAGLRPAALRVLVAICLVRWPGRCWSSCTSSTPTGRWTGSSAG